MNRQANRQKPKSFIPEVRGEFLCSLVTCPSPEQLLKRMWIKKRGHLFRTWRRRWVVIEASMLKYYTNQLATPPYGSNLKGQLTIMGAVCLREMLTIPATLKLEYSAIPQSQSSIPPSCCKMIHRMEMIGSEGEKDLLFEFQAPVAASSSGSGAADAVNWMEQQEAQEWTQMVEWAAHRCTVKQMLKEITTALTSTKRKSDEEVDVFYDWQQAETKRFRAALSSLAEPCDVPVLVRNKDRQSRLYGRQQVQMCSLRLWSDPGFSSFFASDDASRSETHDAGGNKDSGRDTGVGGALAVDPHLVDKYLQNPSVFASQFGLEWVTIKDGREESPCESPLHRRVSFAELSEMLLFRTEAHTGTPVDLYTSGGLSKPKRLLMCLSSKLSMDSSQPFLSAFAPASSHVPHSSVFELQVLCCCLHDHKDLIAHLRSVLLHLDLVKHAGSLILERMRTDDEQQSLLQLQERCAVVAVAQRL